MDATTWTPALLVLGALSSPASAAVQEEAPSTVVVRFTDGEAARLWEEVRPTTEPAALALETWPDWDGEAWRRSGETATDPADDPWARWVATVRAEAGASEPARRASLALLAAAQSRQRDAWAHFAALDGAASRARVMPCFFPGVPADHPVLAGGRPGPLADGARLRPLLPPPDARDRLAGELELEDFAAGDARVTLRLSAQPDGVQIDLRHVAGGRATLVVVLPARRGWERSELHVDWERQDPAAAAARELALTVSADEPERTIWMRERPLPPGAPLVLPERLPSAFVEAGLLLVAPPEERRAAGLRGALEELLGIPCELVAPGTPPAASGPFERHVLRLAPPGPLGPRTPGADGYCELGGLVARAEAFALRRGR